MSRPAIIPAMCLRGSSMRSSSTTVSRNATDRASVAPRTRSLKVARRRRRANWMALDSGALSRAVSAEVPPSRPAPALQPRLRRRSLHAKVQPLAADRGVHAHVRRRQREWPRAPCDRPPPDVSCR